MIKKSLTILHKYIGLVCGVVLSITLLTGALLVYEQPLTRLFNQERYYHMNSGTATNEFNSVINQLNTNIGDQTLTGITWYNSPERTWSASVNDSRDQYFFIPQTGEVVDQFSYGKSFFYQIMSLHRWLLSSDIGRPIVGTCTILFSLILISGFIVWLPMRKKQAKNRLTFDRSRGKKRKLLDAHAIVGLYFVPFLLLMSVTGPTWSFPWYRSALTQLLGGTATAGKPQGKGKKESVKPTLQLTDTEWSNLFRAIKEASPDFVSATIALDQPQDNIIEVKVLPHNGISHKVRDTYKIQIETGAIADVKSWKNASRNDLLRSWFFAVHSGSFGGAITQFIYFVVCLIASTLPITGYIIWYQRRQLASSKHKR